MRTDRLIQAREQKGLGQRECARLAGVSPACLCSIEHGQRGPMASTLKSLCEVLGVSSDWLLGLSEDRVTVPPRLVVEERERFRQAVRAIQDAATRVLCDGDWLHPFEDADKRPSDYLNWLAGEEDTHLSL